MFNKGNFDCDFIFVGKSKHRHFKRRWLTSLTTKIWQVPPPPPPKKTKKLYSNPDVFVLFRTKYPVWHLQIHVCIFYVKVRLMWFKWEDRLRICGAKKLDFIISNWVNVHTAFKTSTGANNWARRIRFCRAGFAGRILLMLLSGLCWFCSPQITFVAERILSKILSKSNRFP